MLVFLVASLEAKRLLSAFFNPTLSLGQWEELEYERRYSLAFVPPHLLPLSENEIDEYNTFVFNHLDRWDSCDPDTCPHRLDATLDIVAYRCSLNCLRHLFEEREEIVEEDWDAEEEREDEPRVCCEAHGWY